MDIVRLSEINHKLNPIVEFDYDDDDKKHNLLGQFAKGAAVGGVAYGGYRANQAIRTRQGAMNAVVPGAKTSYASAAQNLYQSGAQKAKVGIESATKSSGEWMAKLLSKLRGVKLASRTERLIQLNSLLNQVLEFEDRTGMSNKKGQRPETNTSRGLLTGLLTGGPEGAIAGGIEGGVYKKHGVILRKRDVLGHDFVGGLGGSVGAALGAGASRGRPGGLALGGLVGYGAARTAISAHTLAKRRAELKEGYQLN